MADIKLVIDIPEWKYKSICEGIEASKRCGVVGIDHDIHEAIYNGTPLPKNHGRLIDADVIDDNIYELTRSLDLDYSQIINVVDDAPTIVEAEIEE